MNFNQVWRQSDSFQYDCLESPQSFVHKFKCHYAAIQGTFHGETLPDRDRLLKRKLLQEFPRSSIDLPEAFMDDSILLNKFLEHVENKRTILLNTSASVNSVPSQPVKKKILRSSSCDNWLSRSSSQSSVSLTADKSNNPKFEDTLSKLQRD